MAVADPKEVVRHFSAPPNYVHRAEAFFATSPFFVLDDKSGQPSPLDRGDLGSYFSVGGRVSESSFMAVENEADIESLIRLSVIEF